jgi:predicted outer membrane repeat protein
VSQFNRGGAIFFRDEGDVIGSTFNQNEAFQGSAIYSADKRLDVRDSEFIDNKGSFGGQYFWAIHDIKGWYAEDSPTNPHYITVGFDYPGDNYINAIHNFETKPRNVHGNITLSNVTYWVGEIFNSDDGYPIKNCTYAPLILTVIDSEGNEILNDIIMTNGTSVTYDPFQLNYTERIYYNLTHEDDEHYSYWHFAMTLSEARNPSSVVINTVESEFNYDDCTIDFAVENRTLINVRVTNENGDVVFDKNTTEDSISLDVPAYDGYYNVTVYNFGNLYFIPSSDSKLIKIFPTNSAINITPIDDIAYNEKINVEINGENLTTVNVTVYDKDRNVVFSQNITGTTIELPVLDVGEYNITVINYGNESIMGCENSTIFKVIKANNNVLVSVGDVTYGDKAIIVISADVDGEYAVNINGTTKKVNVVNGAGKVSLSLKPGNYLAKASFDNSNYDSAITNATFKVLKATTKISASAVTTTYNVNKNLVITLKDNKGKAVSGVKLTVNLGGNKKYTTDKNGQVKVNVAKLVPKTYTAKISFAGNDIYKAASTTAKVTVKKATPKVTAKAKTFKFEDKAKKYTITLKDNKGKVLKNKKVTLKVNGKTYAAKTNSKGVATFKLTKLNKKGKFNAVITYAGDKYYKKVTKKAKITVKVPAWKTVAEGSKDKVTVKKIQQALKDNGYYLTYKGHYLKVDGVFSSCTVRSIKEFQKAKGLKVTGKVDYATAKKLKIVS